MSFFLKTSLAPKQCVCTSCIFRRFTLPLSTYLHVNKKSKTYHKLIGFYCFFQPPPNAEVAPENDILLVLGSQLKNFVRDFMLETQMLGIYLFWRTPFHGDKIDSSMWCVVCLYFILARQNVNHWITSPIGSYRIHVWYVYLYLVDQLNILVNIPYIDGLERCLICKCCGKILEAAVVLMILDEGMRLVEATWRHSASP